jgi:hypothetical protein
MKSESFEAYDKTEREDKYNELAVTSHVVRTKREALALWLERRYPLLIHNSQSLTGAECLQSLTMFSPTSPSLSTTSVVYLSKAIASV